MEPRGIEQSEFQVAVTDWQNCAARRGEQTSFSFRLAAETALPGGMWIQGSLATGMRMLMPASHGANYKKMSQ